MKIFPNQETCDKFNKNLCDIFNINYQSFPLDENIMSDITELIPWNKGKKGLQVPWNKGIKITGHPHTQESKEKISKAQKGKSKSEESTLKRAGNFTLIDPEGKIYQIKNLAKFARENNLDQGALSKVALGQRPSHKGWVCKKSTNDTILR